MRGRVKEIPVRTQQNQSVSNRELSKECIDRPKLNTATPAAVAHLGCLDVVVAIRRDRWQRRETMQDRVAPTRATKPLQQFLQDEPRGEYRLSREERLAETRNLPFGSWFTSTKRQGPDAGVDQEVHAPAGCAQPSLTPGRLGSLDRSFL